MKLSIVIPAYNEEKTLEELVLRVVELQLLENFEKEIIIMNGGSKDRTWEIMQNLQSKYPEIQAFQNEKNMGKSQTVRNGLLKTTGDFVVIQDADLEYEPKEINDLLSLAVDENCDAVYGNRFGKHNKVIYYQHYYGNKFLSAFSNLFTYPRLKTWIPDMEVCYKLIKGDIIRDIAKNIESKSIFGMEPEITAKLARYKVDGKHLKFGIVPISYYPRSVAEGKKIQPIRDGLKALKEVLVYNLGS